VRWARFSRQGFPGSPDSLSENQVRVNCSFLIFPGFFWHSSAAASLGCKSNKGAKPASRKTAQTKGFLGREKGLE
jgi:hypothetical protein